MFISFYMASTFLTLLNSVWKNSQKNENGVQVFERFFVVYFLWVFLERGGMIFKRTEIWINDAYVRLETMSLS